MRKSLKIALVLLAGSGAAIAAARLRRQLSAPMTSLDLNLDPNDPTAAINALNVAMGRLLPGFPGLNPDSLSQLGFEEDDEPRTVGDMYQEAGFVAKIQDGDWTIATDTVLYDADDALAVDIATKVGLVTLREHEDGYSVDVFVNSHGTTYTEPDLAEEVKEPGITLSTFLNLVEKHKLDQAPPMIDESAVGTLPIDAPASKD